MIKIENIDVTGWDRSDSYFDSETGSYIPKDGYVITTNKGRYYIGEEDLKFMHKLAKASNEHAKFRRMLNVTMLNRTIDMRIESVRDSRGNFCSEFGIDLQNLLVCLYVIFNNKPIEGFIYVRKSVYTTDVAQFFANLYLRFHETDFRTFNMDNSWLFKQAIYEYSPEELEQIISMCTNTELMEEYITSERTSGECKAIVIKRMAELGVDKNRFDL